MITTQKLSLGLLFIIGAFGLSAQSVDSAKNIKSDLSSAKISNTLSLNDKIYGVSKLWSDVNYNFVYMYKIDQLKWNAAYREALANIQTTANDYEYYRELQKLCSLLKDGHTQVYLPDHMQSQVMTTHFGAYRIFLTSVNGRIYIYDVNKSKAKELPIGSEILKVNGLPVAEYQDRFVKPYISTSTESVLNNKAGYGLLAGLEGDQYAIELKTPQGELKNLQLTHSKTEEVELSAPPLADNGLFEFKWLKNDVAYLAIKTFDDASVVKDFESKIPELKKAKKIILDIRNNGGGSGKNALNIAKYFTKSDTIYGARSYSREIIPTERAIGSFLNAQDTINGKAQWGLSKEDATRQYKAYLGTKFYTFSYNPIILESDTKFSVPVSILTNANTASAAEDFLIYLYAERNINRIGDYTNGSTGQPLQIELPGNGSAWICTKKVTLPNGEEFIGRGITPQILVKQTLNDILYPSQYDSQLSEALKFLK